MKGNESPSLESLPMVKEGQLLWCELESLPRKTEKKQEHLRLRAPTRLNFGILDFTEMQPNLPGTHCNSGSLGFGVSLYSQVELTLIDEPKVIIKNLPDGKTKLLNHTALIMKSLTDYRGGFEISADTIPYPHVGLGSTAALTFALYNAINIALGYPFTERELVKISAFNYVEEGPGNKLFPGQSTGMSGWVALKGGICIVTAEAELVIREDLPENYQVIIGLPAIKEKGVVESANELPDLKKFYLYDRFNSARICHWVLMRLIPAIKTKNYKEVGEITWDMFLNSCKGIGVIMLRSSIRLLDLLLSLRKAGGELCFISSVGPAIVTLAPPEAVEALVGVFKEHQLKILKLDVDNKGSQQC